MQLPPQENSESNEPPHTSFGPKPPVSLFMKVGGQRGYPSPSLRLSPSPSAVPGRSYMARGSVSLLGPGYESSCNCRS